MRRVLTFSILDRKRTRINPPAAEKHKIQEIWGLSPHSSLDHEMEDLESLDDVNAQPAFEKLSSSSITLRSRLLLTIIVIRQNGSHYRIGQVPQSLRCRVVVKSTKCKATATPLRFTYRTLCTRTQTSWLPHSKQLASASSSLVDPARLVAMSFQNSSRGAIRS